jgi:hypothetical protein
MIIHIYIYIYIYIREGCNGTHRNADPEVSQKDENRNGVPELSETFFPGIGITNTPLSNRILDNYLRFVAFFKRKIALYRRVASLTFQPIYSSGRNCGIH